MMKEEILEVINGGSISDLAGFLYRRYKYELSKEDQDEFLSIIKGLIIEGTSHEKLVCIMVVVYLDKAHLFEEAIKPIVLSLDFREDEHYISPLLTICASLSNS